MEIVSTIQEALRNPIIAATVAGFIAAASVDWFAFLKFKNAEEAAQYDWKVARFRWLQGTAAGFVAGLAQVGFLQIG